MSDDLNQENDALPTAAPPEYEEAAVVVESEVVEAEQYEPHNEFNETALEIATEEKPASQPMWARMRGAIFGGRNGRETADRLDHLEQAIENAPDTPANYVLRGELYLDAREYALAARDFQRAYELAVKQFERSDWGLIAQAMQDRALIGLQKAEKKLQAEAERQNTAFG
jgi:hypothetical protein